MENWTIENFMIVGQAMLKMLGFFWPVVLAAIIMTLWSRKELANEKK